MVSEGERHSGEYGRTGRAYGSKIDPVKGAVIQVAQFRATQASHDRPAAVDLSTVAVDKPNGLYRYWEYRNIFLLCLDAVLVFFALVAAYNLRFHFAPVLHYLPIRGDQVPTVWPYLKISMLNAGIWVFLLAKEQSYSKGLHLASSLPNQIMSVVISGVYSLGLLMIISFMFRYFLLSRVVYVMGFGLGVTALVLVRIIFHTIDRRLDAKCVIFNRVVFLGDHPHAKRLLEHFHTQNPCTAVIGRLSWGQYGGSDDTTNGDVPLLGEVWDLDRIYSKAPFDQLIVVSHAKKHPDENGSYQYPFVTALNFCEGKAIPVYMVPDILDVTVQRREIGSMAGLPLIGLKDSSLHSVYALVKRLLDLVISLTVLILGLPLWITIVVLIRLTSPGPALYRETRVGLHGRPFTMLKFRSMVNNANEQLRNMVDFEKLEEPVFNIRRDPRVTTIGRFLRRTSLDEIPQFINVLFGAMSVVGPRPERLELVERYNAYQRRRLKAKPGITGYQQVTSRGDPSLAKRIEYDLWYLKHQGVLLDLFILLKTILVIFRGDGVE
jgi:exopolysaccharide biosynthesis polyprenyl glycosylphosphotransferase